MAVYLLAGLAVGAASIYILGYTSAVAIPAAYFSWFRAQGGLELGLLISDFLLIFSTIGLLSMAVLLTAHRLIVGMTRLSIAAFVAAVFLVPYVILPFAEPFPPAAAFLRPWWTYAFELSIILASLLGYLVAWRLWPNQSFKPNPLRGSA
jgi:hypothetical protein